LEKDHWHRETVDVVDGGAVGVRLLLLRIRSNKPIQVVGLEFMRIACEGRKVAYAIIAGAPAEGLLALWRERAQRRIAARCRR
jgi:hypothetical protein